MISFTTSKTDGDALDPLIPAWTHAAERAEADRQRDVGRAREFLLARVALRQLLAAETGHTDWSVEKDSNGKPSVVRAGTASPFISLSHTRGMVACAVTHDGPVGIDVEYQRPRNFLETAQQAFGPHECAWVAREGGAAFYTIWTLREAIAKATGAGLAGFSNGQDVLMAYAPFAIDHHNRFALYYEMLSPDYCVAIAVAGQPAHYPLTFRRSCD